MSVFSLSLFCGQCGRMLYLALLLGRYKLVKKAGNETNFLSGPRYGSWIPVFLQVFEVNVV
jgi:hypothetical protein